ncbi:MAG: nucleotidyltransferase family protein [Sphingomonas sp.]|nr:nucleotidyltransferase family protein [Sphingomonas sp.]
MARADRLVVALLAAGRSMRFGADDKLMAPLGGQPLIAWAAAAGRSLPALDHILIGHPGLQAEAAAPGYRLVVNPAPEEGLSTSLRLAAHAARDTRATALLILLADMPFVDPTHLGRLLAAQDEEPDRAVFSSAGGVAQPPALFPASLFDAILSSSGDKGAKHLSRQAILIEADRAQLTDIDTPEELDRAALVLSARRATD